MRPKILRTFADSSRSLGRFLYSGWDGLPTRMVLACLWFVGFESLRAQNHWTGTGQGDWFDSGNWSWGEVPTDLQAVSVSNSGTAVIAGPDEAVADTVVVSDFSEVRLEGSGSRLTTARMFISGAGVGTVRVLDGGFLDVESFGGEALTVGHDNGLGTLEILSGGTVVQGADARLGTEYAGSRGIVNVRNAGSSWTVENGSLTVGEVGRGTLRIEDGGVVSVGHPVFLGYSAGATGGIYVDGVGSRFTLLSTFPGHDLKIGEDGHGILEITNGGRVETGIAGDHLSWAVLADQFGTSGNVLVDGEGSSWAIGSTLALGYRGSGTMVISDGGQVTSKAGSVGVLAGSQGFVDLQGEDSRWTVDETLRIGEAGTGTVQVSEGATLALGASLGASLFVGSGNARGELDILTGGTVVQEGSASIATESAVSRGVVTVRGAESSWLIEGGPLMIAERGDGELFVEDGGVVSVSNAVAVGQFADARGFLLVDGVGSLLTQTATLPGQDLKIGDAGLGNMEITGGGRVETGITGDHLSSAILANGADSSASVLVSGTGSSWEIGGILQLGYGGVADMTISEGAQVTSSGGYFATGSDSTGNLLIQGAGSSWTTSQPLSVGNLGTGFLNIEAGGRLNANGGLTLGSLAGSSAYLTVDGADSQLAVTTSFGQQVIIGNSGTGELTITNGAKMTNSGNAWVYLGYNTGSIGNVFVDGAGSSWTIGNTSLVVGRQGSGELDITNGAVVSAANATLGDQVGSDGVVTVVGSGTWSLTNGAQVGRMGLGIVDVYGGGDLTGYLTLGVNSTGVGEAYFSGNGSTWSWGGAAGSTVGSLGQGLLWVGNGAQVSGVSLSVGGGSSGRGEVDIRGASTGMVLSSALFVGASGTGTMGVHLGAQVSSSRGSIGQNSTGDGTMVVSGSSRWSVTGTNSSDVLEVGRAGEGTLEIVTGGRVEVANRAVVGDLAGSDGHVTVWQDGASWTVANGIQVGNSGTGLVDIGNRAHLSGHLLLGVNSGGHGEAYVGGTGSIWTWSHTAGSVVGSSGRGVLVVSPGGQVSGGSLSIGAGASGRGEVSISGSTAGMTLSSGLIVGASGTGTLDVRLGTQLSSARGMIGQNPTGNGEVIVSDSAHWMVTGTNSGDVFEVGRGGTGRLEIREGGTVDVAHRAVVGGQSSSSSSSIGEVLVGNATWTVNGGITLAANATATAAVTLNSGALVTTSQVEKGDADGLATWNFNGGTLRLTEEQNTLFANFNDGDVNILAGGATIDMDHNAVIHVGLQGEGGYLRKEGYGRLTLRGTNLFTGPVHLLRGTLEIAGTGSINQAELLYINGEFRYNSSVNYDGGEVQFSGTLSGTNWQGGLSGLAVGAIQTISPGNSPGHAVTGSQTWEAFGTYLWEINDADGEAGVNWDLITFTESLTVLSDEVMPFTIQVTSLTLDDAPGVAQGFSAFGDYRWLIAESAGEILFLPGAFAVNTDHFVNPFDGEWSLLRGDEVSGGTSNQLYLAYTGSAVPEPGTLLMVVAGGLLLGLRRRRGHR